MADLAIVLIRITPSHNFERSDKIRPLRVIEKTIGNT
jgi:hypothetical protein